MVRLKRAATSSDISGEVVIVFSSNRKDYELFWEARMEDAGFGGWAVSVETGR
jgi:hypothetical protein